MKEIKSIKQENNIVTIECVDENIAKAILKAVQPMVLMPTMFFRRKIEKTMNKNKDKLNALEEQRND